MNKKIIKKSYITFIIIFIILLFSLMVIIFKDNTNKDITKELTECIGDNSILFVNIGCPHCITQKELFGEYVEYLNIIDCIKDTQDCVDSNIARVPSWIINGKKINGILEIKELRKETGC